MRSTVMTVGIALLVSLTVGSSIVASGATAVDAPTAAETGTAVTIVEGDSGLVLTDEGTISIDDRESEIGLNPNARFTFGDAADPASEHAFAVRASSETRDDLLVRYVDASGHAVENVRLTFNTEAGTEVGRIGFDERETTGPRSITDDVLRGHDDRHGGHRARRAGPGPADLHGLKRSNTTPMEFIVAKGVLTLMTVAMALTSGYVLFSM